jgi:hypothetical protein
LAGGSLQAFHSLVNHVILHGLGVATKEAISSTAASGLISRDKSFSSSVRCSSPEPLFSRFDHFYLAQTSFFSPLKLQFTLQRIVERLRGFDTAYIDRAEPLELYCF